MRFQTYACIDAANTVIDNCLVTTSGQRMFEAAARTMWPLTGRTHRSGGLSGAIIVPYGDLYLSQAPLGNGNFSSMQRSDVIGALKKLCSQSVRLVGNSHSTST